MEMGPSEVGRRLERLSKWLHPVDLNAIFLPIAAHAEVIKNILQQADRCGRLSILIEPVKSSQQISMLLLESLIILCVFVGVFQEPVRDVVALVRGYLLVCLSVGQPSEQWMHSQPVRTGCVHE